MEKINLKIKIIFCYSFSIPYKCEITHTIIMIFPRTDITIVCYKIRLISVTILELSSLFYIFYFSYLNVNKYEIYSL